MSKRRREQRKIKQTEQLGFTAEKKEETIKSKENSDNLPPNQVSHQIKAAARHSQTRTGSNRQSADTFPLHALYSHCF